MNAQSRNARRIPGSGDGWAAGPSGGRVWGLNGAAGLFLIAEHDGDLCVLLQLRAKWTNQGGTWGMPGGARDQGETAVEAAVREAVEECGLSAGDIDVLWDGVTSGPADAPADGELPGGWTYTTVIARTVSGRPLPTSANDESDELRWVPFADVAKLPLLAAFGESLPDLIDKARELYK